MGNLAPAGGLLEKLYISFSDSVNIESLLTGDFLLERIYLVNDNKPEPFFKLHKVLEWKKSYYENSDHILLKTKTLNFENEIEISIVKICLGETQRRFFYPDKTILSLFSEKQLEEFRGINVSTR